MRNSLSETEDRLNIALLATVVPLVKFGFAFTLCVSKILINKNSEMDKCLFIFRTIHTNFLYNQLRSSQQARNFEIWLNPTLKSG